MTPNVTGILSAFYRKTQQIDFYLKENHVSSVADYRLLQHTQVFEVDTHAALGQKLCTSPGKQHVYFLPYFCRGTLTTHLYNYVAWLYMSVLS
jgi:hypothetical protein